ncbi:hypothetical protein DFJ74DRAFT_680490 [Hyaloraphidium curvatum]|nr:hypothetical protein DFJ74DRAFT_680490 [Hyaloraphidium curvatum]
MPAKLQYLDARACSKEDVVRAIREDGACVVTNLISAEAADRIVSEMTPFIERTTKGNDDFAGMNTTRTGALAARSPTFNKEVLVNPFLLAAAEDNLLPWCKRFHVMATQVIRIGPKSPAQPWHRDRQAWGKDMLTDQVEPELASVWALSDFTKENGATRIAPKTHLRPLDWDYVPSEEETCYAVMPKGSAVIYTGSAMHSGGENVTKDQWRIGMHLSFAVGWLRQEEDQKLSVPIHIARTLDPMVQELIGYAAADYTLGYASPPRLEDMPPADLIKTHDAAPLGSDTLVPEVFLGRAPRPWGESAGARRDSSLIEGKLVKEIYSNDSESKTQEQAKL